MPEVGAEVRHRAHEKAPGGTALDHDAILRRPAVLLELLAAGDEIGEGVHLVRHAARLVPGLAEIAAAADVRHREDDAAVEERDDVAAAGERRGDAARAV